MAGKAELSPFIAEALKLLAAAVTGVLGTFGLVKVANRNAVTTLLSADKTSKTQVDVKLVDDRMDFTHILTAERTEIKAELAEFRRELKASERELMDYREQLGIAKIKIEEQRLQILGLQEENLRRRQETQETINRQADEIKVLSDRLSVQDAELLTLRGDNQALRQELKTLTAQVRGNTSELQTIGSFEAKSGETLGVPGSGGVGA